MIAIADLGMRIAKVTKLAGICNLLNGIGYKV